MLRYKLSVLTLVFFPFWVISSLPMEFPHAPLFPAVV